MHVYVSFRIMSTTTLKEDTVGAGGLVNDSMCIVVYASAHRRAFIVTVLHLLQHGLLYDRCYYIGVHGYGHCTELASCCDCVDHGFKAAGSLGRLNGGGHNAQRTDNMHPVNKVQIQTAFSSLWMKTLFRG